MLFFRFFRTWKVVIPFLAIVVFGGLGILFFSDEASEGASEEVYKTVELIRADELENVPVVSTTLGTVQSDHEVEIRAETSGRIVSIGVKKGAVVEPDSILLELDHQILDAQILQAEARLASARAQLAKLRNGERPEDIAILEQKILAEKERLKEMRNGAPAIELALIETQISNAQKNVEDAKRDFDNVQETVARELQTELEKGFDTIRNVSSVMSGVLSENLQNVIYPIRFPTNETCRLRISAFQEKGIESRCFTALEESEQQKLLAENLESENLTETFVLDNLNISKNRVLRLQNFLSLAFEIVNGTIAIERDRNTTSITEGELTALKAPITAAQASVDNLLNQLTVQIESMKNQKIADKATLDTARSAVTQAENALLNLQKEYEIKKSGATSEQIVIQETQIRQLELQLDIAKNGARSEDILAQEAQVKQAQADLAISVANRDKAIIRSPLRGTVLQLPFEIGDYVNAGESLAIVANREALQVKTFITEKEKDLVMVDGKVSAEEGKVKGLVEEISPALEQETKKIEVLVRLTEGTEDLVLGQTIFVHFESSLTEGTLRVPLSSVRIVGENAFVLTVDADGIITSLPVSVGNLLEDTVIISGVAPDQLIIRDVLGIKEGEKVHSSSFL